MSVRAQILNLLRDLQDEFDLTYLFISTTCPVVESICDRVAVMYFGHIVELASTSELYARPQHPYTEALLSAVPKPDPRLRDQGRRIRLPDDLPDPIAAGRVLLPHRCRYAQAAVCAVPGGEPPLKEVAAEHDAALRRGPPVGQPTGAAYSRMMGTSCLASGDEVVDEAALVRVEFAAVERGGVGVAAGAGPEHAAVDAVGGPVPVVVGALGEVVSGAGGLQVVFVGDPAVGPVADVVDLALVGRASAGREPADRVAGADVGQLVGGGAAVQPVFGDQLPVVGDPHPPDQGGRLLVDDPAGHLGRDGPEAGQVGGVVVPAEQGGRVDGEGDGAGPCRWGERAGAALGGRDGRVGAGEQVEEHVGPQLVDPTPVPAGVRVAAVRVVGVGVAGAFGGGGHPGQVVVGGAGLLGGQEPAGPAPRCRRAGRAG